MQKNDYNSDNNKNNNVKCIECNSFCKNIESLNANYYEIHKSLKLNNKKIIRINDLTNIANNKIKELN